MKLFLSLFAVVTIILSGQALGCKIEDSSKAKQAEIKKELYQVLLSQVPDFDSLEEIDFGQPINCGGNLDDNSVVYILEIVVKRRNCLTNYEIMKTTTETGEVSYDVDESAPFCR